MNAATVTLEYTRSEQIAEPISPSHTGLSFQSKVGGTGELSEIRLLTSAMNRRRSVHVERVLRRMHGVLLEFTGDDARVILREESAKVEYFLPADPLRHAGIKIPGQPFEMDEFEQRGEKECSVGYRYRPAALEKDSYIETFSLDKERKQKLDAILNNWEDSQY